jgi:hypothetical protein
MLNFGNIRWEEKKLCCKIRNFKIIFLGLFVGLFDVLGSTFYVGHSHMAP